MFPKLPSPLEAGLHEDALKKALNESKAGRLKVYAEQLINQLPQYIRSTEQKVAARISYELDRGVRLRALNSKSIRNDENRLEATIHARWRMRGQQDDFLRSFETGQAIVKFVPSSQVPTFNKLEKENWGYVDLLGCGLADDPIVIELKILRLGKGGRTPRVETPLRAVVEALAYAISLKEAWQIFYPQWESVVHPQISLKKPSGLKLIVLGTRKYWTEVTERCRWYPQAKEALPLLVEALKAEGFSCHFATIDAECIPTSGRRWIINGPAVEVHPW